MVIDWEHGVCEEVYAKYGAVAIQGNATDLDTLESAGIDRCDIAVATMKNDADNLAFALLAKHHGVSQVIVRMNDPKYENIYKTVGVKNISRGAELLVSQIMFSIESPELRTVISFDEIEICLFIIPEGTKSDGITVADLVSRKGFPVSVNITCVFKDSTHSYCIPRGNTVLNANDKLFICGTREDVEAAVNFID